MLWMFTAISIIPTIVIGLVTTFSVKKAIEERLIAEVQSANVQCLESIEEILGIYEECMDRIQKELPLEEYFENFGTFSKEKFYERIHSIVSTSMLENPLIKENLETTNYVKDITNVHFINHETGEILSLYETPAIYEYPKNANWGIYRNAQSHKAGTIYFHSYKDGVGKEMLGTTIKAIYEEEKLLGYIALDIPLEVIKEQTAINSTRLPLHFSLISDQNYVLWDDNGLEHTASFLESKYFMEEGTYTVDDKEIFISKAKSDSYPIQLFGGFNLELILGNLNTIWYIWITAIIVLILLCVITTWKVTKIVINPLKILTSNMKLVENGNFDVSIDMENDDEFGYVARRFNDMCETIKELFRTNEEKQKQLRIAEVKKLQSQINPHFLYNTLDSIKYLAK